MTTVLLTLHHGFGDRVKWFLAAQTVSVELPAAEADFPVLGDALHLKLAGALATLIQPSPDEVDSLHVTP